MIAELNEIMAAQFVSVLQSRMATRLNSFSLQKILDEASANGLAVDLHGDLALILSLASGGTARKRAPATRSAHNEKLPTAMAGAMAVGSYLTVVAGTRNHRQLTPVRVTC